MPTGNCLGIFESITEGWRAMDCFTDRREAVLRFLEYVNVDPLPKQILFFYGDGGNGKSLLLNYLSTYCCKRLSPNDWPKLKDAVSEDDLPKFLKEVDGEKLPSTMIDFGAVRDENPLDAFSAMQMLYRRLTRMGFSFPIYNYACALYAQRTYRSVSSILPAEEMDLAAAIIDIFANSSYGTLAQSFINVFNKHCGEKVALYIKGRQISEEDLWTISRLSDNQLYENIPKFFAQDLREAVAASNITRLILFFDTHEAFWGERRDESSGRIQHRDEWFRLFLLKVLGDPKIMTVVAGRESPRWDSVIKNKIKYEYLDQRHIACFTRHDAQEYLKRAGVDPQMHRCMLEAAQESPDQIHPFYLGLCVDIWKLSLLSNKPLTPGNFIQNPEVEEKRKELKFRLLRTVNQRISDTIDVLRICRTFDEELYYYLGDKLHLAPDRSTFDIIKGFSFVRTIHSQDGTRYQVHNLLRPAVDERNETIINIDKILEKYYLEKSKQDPTFIAEKIYHANRIDPEQGLEEWNNTFYEALNFSHYDICQALMEIQLQLKVSSDVWRGIIAQNIGKYLFRLSRYNEAEISFWAALSAYQVEQNTNFEQIEVISYNKGNTLDDLGDLLARTAKYSEAYQTYQEAITNYGQALEQAPDYIEAYNNKGNTLQGLGDLLARTAKYSEAYQTYQEAIISYRQALEQAPDYIEAYNNKGSVLQGLGDLLTKTARYSEALQSYQEAIACYDQVLLQTPEDIYAYNNKGNALQALGAFLTSIAKYSEAFQTYQDAISIFDQALFQAPNLIEAYVNKGTALQRLSNLQETTAEYQGAIQACQYAILTYNQAISLSPNDITININKGISLQCLGNLFTTTLKYSEAIQAYQDAISIIDQALLLAPDYINAYDNKGNAIKCLGDLFVITTKHHEAFQSYQDAISCYTKALFLAPNSIYAYNNKGNALQSLGDLLATTAKYSEAIQAYQDAILCYDQALLRAPDEINIHFNKGLTLMNNGTLIMKTDQNKAKILFVKALSESEKCIRIAPMNEQFVELKTAIEKLLANQS
jgi:tetratricopeptide (TPR) repeat protein